MPTFGFRAGPTVTPTALSATVSWENDQPGDGQVFAKTDPAQPFTIVNHDGTVDALSHQVVIPQIGSVPLEVKTTYYYVAKSTNQQRQVVALLDPPGTFITRGAKLRVTQVQPFLLRRYGVSKITVFCSDPVTQQPLVNIPVTVEVRFGTGQVGPEGQPPVGSSVTVNSVINGEAKVDFTADGRRGLTALKVFSTKGENETGIFLLVLF